MSATPPPRLLTLRSPDQQLQHFHHHAMACDWGLFLLDEAPAYAAQVAHEVWTEVDRLESELSRFRPASDIARLNAAPAQTSVRLGPDAIACLALAADMNALTAGTFDITAGSPSSTTAPRLVIDTTTRAAARTDSAVRVDLGGIGKGYAIDCAVERLRAWGVRRAVLHSGQSTLYALGAPPGHEAWSVSLRDPADHTRKLFSVALHNQAIAGSGIALHGDHIIDPRTGRAETTVTAAWSLSDSAATADALSTAFMLLDAAAIRGVLAQRPHCRAWHARRDDTGLSIADELQP